MWQHVTSRPSVCGRMTSDPGNYNGVVWSQTKGGRGGLVTGHLAVQGGARQGSNPQNCNAENAKRAGHAAAKLSLILVFFQNKQNVSIVLVSGKAMDVCNRHETSQREKKTDKAKGLFEQKFTIFNFSYSILNFLSRSTPLNLSGDLSPPRK